MKRGVYGNHKKIVFEGDGLTMLLYYYTWIFIDERPIQKDREVNYFMVTKPWWKYIVVIGILKCSYQKQVRICTFKKNIYIENKAGKKT